MVRTSVKQSPLLERLLGGGVLISDGATGTYLQSHGLEPGGCPEEFNASHPETVRQMAKDYFDAGSDMVLTNSFGANKFMLKKYGHGNRVTELNKLAAQHARSAAPPGGLVAGSVGPSGEFLEPLGEVTEAEMLEAFKEQVTALAEGGADGDFGGARQQESLHEVIGLLGRAALAVHGGARGLVGQARGQPGVARKVGCMISADRDGDHAGVIVDGPDPGDGMADPGQAKPARAQQGVLAR